MQKLISYYKTHTDKDPEGFVGVLFGLRFMMVFFVAQFHIWQQSWLTPTIEIFGARYSMDALLRSGYMWVDGMLFLSAFLLYLPYAIAKEKGKPSPKALNFYKKRLVRIAPSYYLCVIIMLFFSALPNNSYASFEFLIKDLLAHLTFTHTLFPLSYYASPLNGALWTIGVQMQFYLLFPLLANGFKKRPLFTYVLMTGAAFLFRAYALSLKDSAMYFNQMPAFLDVFANGFLACSVYENLRRNLKETSLSKILFSIIFFICALAFYYILKEQAAESGVFNIRQGQLKRRFVFSCLMMVLSVSLCFSLGGIRIIFSNRLARFLAGISYQFYMYHQVFAVFLKKVGIPPSKSPAPHMAGEFSWQVLYVFLSIAGATIISAVLTYAFEKPISKMLLKKRNRV
ncbi:MAG: acyltransferase [Eubacteriales bacterium]|nr:acyltransferase [Eubacteriales bacterium]